MCSQPSRLAGANLSQITAGELGCGQGFSDEVVVVAIICAAVLVLALGTENGKKSVEKKFRKKT